MVRFGHCRFGSRARCTIGVDDVHRRRTLGQLGVYARPENRRRAGALDQDQTGATGKAGASPSEFHFRNERWYMRSAFSFAALASLSA
jgi:hypothetical protein